MIISIAAIFVLVAVKETNLSSISFHPDYKEALRLSLLFYESQRSGKLPASNRIAWRGDSALNDRGVNGEDLTGGYYDASDFVKFSFTIAFTTTILSWGVLLYKNGYIEAGEYQHVLEAIKWSTDYFIKCHVSPEEFYGQVGDFPIDHAYWGRPEDMNMSRPAYKIDRDHPGSDLASEAAATFASSSMVFRGVNGTYSDELLRHAKELYDFAKTYKGLYQNVIPGAKQYYDSTSYLDELTWASLWLYKATGSIQHLEDAEELYKHLNTSEESRFFYNSKRMGILILLAEATGKDVYTSEVRASCNHAIEDQYRTPKGLIFVEKLATLAHSSNLAFVCLAATDLPGVSSKNYYEFAKEQIDYILGANGNRSYLVGYGSNYPKKPYNAASSCPDRPQSCGWSQYNSSEPNPQILYGALVSGPDQNDHYEDSREEFLYNDVTLDQNAGFQSALAGVIHFQKRNYIS